MQVQRLHDEIIRLKKASSFGLLEVGMLLYQLEQERGWEALSFQDLTALITAPEDEGGLEMDKHNASKLKGVYEHYVVGEIATMEKLKELGGEPYKFYEAIPLIKTPAELELLRLPLTEIRKIRIQGDKSISELAACKHMRFKDWRHCLDCDAWIEKEHSCDVATDKEVK